MLYAGCKTPVPKRPNAVMEMSIATVQKDIGELQHKVDEKEASRNVGNCHHEREETIRSSVHLPVMETLPASSGDGRPARGTRTVCLVGFWSVLGSVAARSMSQCSHAPWAIDGTRVVPSPPPERLLEEYLPRRQSGSGSVGLPLGG